jgi:predicted ATPase
MPLRGAITRLVGTTARGPRLVLIDGADDGCNDCVDVACGVINQVRDHAVMVTSRISPGVPGIQCHSVRSLSLPQQVDSKVPANASEAVRLFICRAQEAQSGWLPTTGDATYIAEICRQLDGLPIAIEAAARLVRTITLAELAERVGRSQNLLDLLEPHTRPGHTIRAGVEWSCQRLKEHERVALMAFCQLDGVFTLDVADGIVRSAGLPAASGVAILQRLVDLCLVEVDDVTTASGRKYRVPNLVKAVVHDEGTRLGLVGAASAAVREFFGDLWNGAAGSMHTTAEYAQMQRVRRTHRHIPALLR